MSETASARHRDGDDRENVGWSRSSENGVDARAIGSAIHRALEEFDFGADEKAEIEHRRDTIARDLAQAASIDRVDQTVAAGMQLWDKFARGSLFARLRELSDQIVARELSVLRPPSDEEGPVGFRAGVIDLVYHDPSSDQLVVVDYKTDQVAEPAALQSRAESYAEQSAAYRHALEDAFKLSYTPRFELWFLDADKSI
jgi:ATP-dependent exoDNAse (exonuclease V) beta subunit